MQRGQVARLTYLTDVHPDGTQVGWRPPKGKVFVVCVLGVEDKKLKDGSVPLDVDATLHDMGWRHAGEA